MCERFRRWFFDVVKGAALLTLVTAGAADEGSPPSADHWKVIEAYDQASRVYSWKLVEIFNADVTAREKERLQRDLGPVPDDSAAVAAAIAIIESNGERLLDAADLLLNRARPSERDQQSVLDVLAKHFGPNWSLVEDYIEDHAEWLDAARAIGSGEEAARRYEQGVEPPTWHAASAARAIVESSHERALDAAEFLAQPTYVSGVPAHQSVWLGRPWWLAANRHFGESALAKLIGPDWTVVQDYADRSQAWKKAEQAIREVGADDEETARLLEELGDAPEAYRAVIAALAIIDTGGAHEKTREAAEFLLDNPLRRGATKVLRGAQTLAAYFPDYDQWPLRLKQVNRLSSVHEPTRQFITRLAETLDDPQARATARYFAASYLIQSANNQQTAVDKRLAARERAEELAAGLSAGIENEMFVLTKRGTDGTEVPMTFSDAEAELRYSLESTMVGDVVFDVRAQRVDGTEDALADYAGRVVLVDFWATWCGPCIAAFPKLRQMVAELPKERFQIIGISVDEELDTVTGYLAKNPLPWVVWHVGTESELVRKWRVTGFPTYVLIGPEGNILAKHPGTFSAEFRAEVEQAVQRYE